MVNQWLVPVLLGTAFVAGCDMGPGMIMRGEGGSASYTSNGERIYLTGASESGSTITSTGRGIHQRMMGGGCAACHGSDRQGRRLMPQFWKIAPPLTRDSLFETHDDGDGHGGHQRYADESLRQAVFWGIDPAGMPLDDNMPRWSMSESDWQDLLEYLRS